MCMSIQRQFSNKKKKNKSSDDISLFIRKDFPCWKTLHNLHNWKVRINNKSCLTFIKWHMKYLFVDKCIFHPECQLSIDFHFVTFLTIQSTNYKITIFYFIFYLNVEKLQIRLSQYHRGNGWHVSQSKAQLTETDKKPQMIRAPFKNVSACVDWKEEAEEFF